MKKQILFFGIFILIFQIAFSNSNKTSKIVFYREYSLHGTTISHKVFVGGSMVVKLKNNSYYSYTCLPGEYNIHVENFKNTYLNLIVEEGKTYYLRFGFKAGMFSIEPELILVDGISASPIINSGELRDLNNKHIPLERPKNRFGIIMDMGFGFEKYDVSVITKKENSKISFGGGTSFGFKYGYEANKYLDLSLSIISQQSVLNTSLTDAFISFKRTAVYATPALIIPLDGGDIMRLKLGTGLNYYFNSHLVINYYDANSIYTKNKWKYEDGLGYHFNINFEFNKSKNLSFNYGLKYNNVVFSYDEGKKPHPTIEKLKYPDGSGIDFNMTIYYNF